ncbi:hypothetical protein PsorP6_016124 [Peronosclerospora sorghi]|uniref:Uncharacterized protein n=1 Tax=Peronosclerospora sorghi TaxID=230839 RepID=A0ACC0VRY9_9STRA|nr:hypothetical protein PsorP6_016124 [Peronosclerospora sorghi]
MGYESSERPEHQIKILTVASAVSSVLSIIGILYILGRYWYARRLQAKSLAVYAASAHHLDVTKELIHVLAYLDLFGAIGRAFGVLPTKTFNQVAGEPVTAVCKLQAFLITFGDGAPIAWNFIMALNLYQWVCLGEDQQMLLTKLKWYIAGTLVATLSIPTLCLVWHKFGDAALWCWIVVDSDPTEELWWMIGALYFWVVAGACAMATFLVLVKMNMKKRLKTHVNDDATDAYDAVVHNLTVYISGFLFCWCPAVAHRVYVFWAGEPSFPLYLLHATIVPLQGFINAVIYGKFHIWVRRHVRTPWVGPPPPTRPTSPAPRLSFSKQGGIDAPAIRAQEQHHELGTASLFVTTFDLEWRACPPNLHDWIPSRHDLYVFSLQHVVDVQATEQQLRGYLLQVNYPAAYRSITSIAGTTVRGTVQDASVCQIVFVNHADDASGNVAVDAVDGRMGAHKHSLVPQVVGLPLRYFDASLAFVACDLTPSSDTTPTTTLEAKQDEAARLVHAFSMSADRAAVDFPHLYHHTILAGNLNFDIAMPTASVYGAIEQAYKAACLQRATDAAIDAQLHALDKTDAASRRATQKMAPCDLEAGRRCSHASSCSSMHSVYEHVETNWNDELPFTVLQSPHVHDDNARASKHSASTFDTWTSFLDAHLLPSPCDASSDATKPRGMMMDRRLAAAGPDKLRTYKKIRDLVGKAHLVADKTARQWSHLLRYDQLRASMEAKEIFTGFEEPTIDFLPTFPRKRGVAASFSMVGERSCCDLFTCVNNDNDDDRDRPAYKDRILVHSLDDTKERLTCVQYWSCEAILTSSHKPVCTLYELAIDRFFSYKNDQAAVADLRQGNHALRDKRDMREFKIKLVNLDVHLWTYAERDDAAAARRPTSRRSSTSGAFPSTTTSTSRRSGFHASVRAGPPSSFVHLVGRVFGKSRGPSSNNSTHASGVSDHASSRDDPRFSASRRELLPVEPVRLATIFPLPSDDVYALQRKVYEVAHFVQKGFHSSARMDEHEEAHLAYTNCRTRTWHEAKTHGLTHSALTQTVNGSVHLALRIDAANGQGGQGVLCLHERDLMAHAAPMLDDATPLPFDLVLTWGGTHVGYLHGDVLCAM